MTSYQTLNIGIEANDGTGDVARDAFAKVKQNFELLLAEQASLTLQIASKANQIHQHSVGQIEGFATAVDSRVVLVLSSMDFVTEAERAADLQSLAIALNARQSASSLLDDIVEGFSAASPLWTIRKNAAGTGLEFAEPTSGDAPPSGDYVTEAELQSAINNLTLSAGAVTSVAGRAGDVTLLMSDISGLEEALDTKQPAFNLSSLGALLVESPDEQSARENLKVPASDPSGITGASAIDNIIKITESAYNAADIAGALDPSAVYIITDAPPELSNAIIRQTFANTDVSVNLNTTSLAQTAPLTAARLVTLPSASAVPAGHTLTVIDESGTAAWWHPIRIQAAGGNTINGFSRVAIVLPYGAFRLISNGVNAWYASEIRPAYQDAIFLETDFHSDVSTSYGANQVIALDGSMPAFRSNANGSGTLRTLAGKSRGVATLTSGSTSDRFNMNTDALGFRFGEGLLRICWEIETIRLNNGSDDFRFGIGFGNATGSPTGTNGAWFSYNGSGDPSATHWIANTASGSVSRANTNVPVSIDRVVLGVESPPNGSEARFFVNGVLTNTLTTNLPNLAGREFGVFAAYTRATGSTSNLELMALDAARLLFIPSDPRY